MRTELVTAPAAEPITLIEAKNHLKITYSEDDDLIGTLIEASRKLVEVKLKQSLVTQTYDLFLNGWYDEVLTNYPGRYVAQQAVYIPRGPVQSVTSVQFLDTTSTVQTLATTSYIVSKGAPGRITPSYGHYFPTTLPVIDSVIIRYVAGYGVDGTEVPANIKQAMLLLIGLWYESRSAAGEKMDDLPFAVDALLSASKHSWLT